MVLEVEALTSAWDTARRNALNRLSEEALQVGADIVVGVELRRGEHDLAKRTIDYLISGTAIRLPGSTKTNWPLLSDLSVQDYWKLHNAGYEPVGLVAATTVVFASASRTIRRRRCSTSTTAELAEQDVPALERDGAERPGLCPDVSGEPRVDRALAVGVEDQQHPVL